MTLLEKAREYVAAEERAAEERRWKAELQAMMKLGREVEKFLQPLGRFKIKPAASDARPGNGPLVCIGEWGEYDCAFFYYCSTRSCLQMLQYTYDGDRRRHALEWVDVRNIAQMLRILESNVAEYTRANKEESAA